MTSSVRGLVLFLLQQSSEIDKLKQELPDLMLNEANFMAITKAMSEASGAPDGRYRADQTLASAMASKVQSIYTGIESILKDTLEQVDGYTPTGENWHRKLLDQASRPSPDGIRVPLISGGTLKTLELLRKFRHFSRNAYGVELDAERICAIARDCQAGVQQFATDFLEFKNMVVLDEGASATPSRRPSP